MSKTIVLLNKVNANRIISQTLSQRQLTTSPTTNDQQTSPIEAKKNESIKLSSLLKEHVSLYAKKKEKINYEGMKFYDPPYINKEQPFPNYDLLNINLRGYDYAVLDTYYKYIERLCNSFKVDVVESYAMPSRALKIKSFQPFSATLDKEFKLNNYHRIVRVQNLKSTLAPLLFESIQLNLPEGVQMNVTVPTEEEDEFRYVPDIELNELKQKLEESKTKK